ncbi:hypothetical protein CAEBREN_07442 [Caenorhabditis brenneri]|uniref:Uncharacterized protein n=1 Tax=Caenorhabditis brenneri TaxID=135651 RepID=G0NYJ1_CAEBE|nr:hypothetical protein CAEBREN_07442 [Caenorhabditis brenneri]
MFPFPPTYPP